MLFCSGIVSVFLCRRVTQSQSRKVAERPCSGSPCRCFYMSLYPISLASDIVVRWSLIRCSLSTDRRIVWRFGEMEIIDLVSRDSETLRLYDPATSRHSDKPIAKYRVLPRPRFITSTESREWGLIRGPTSDKDGSKPRIAQKSATP
jgi:hypothetical protein